MNEMTVEEFVRIYSKDSPFELVDGERRAVKPMVAGYATVLKNLYDPLSQYVNEHQLGEVYYRLPYLIVDNDGMVRNARVPDLMFIGRERMAQYIANRPNWEAEPFLEIPDLAVQIAFYNDDGESHEKARRYIEDGVRL